MNNISDTMASIVAIFTNNGLTELSLANYDELNDPAYVIWFDNDRVPYDDPVVKIMLEDTQLSVEVEARNFSNNITLQDYEIDRLEWWRCLHASVLEVLEQDGKHRCPACGKILKGQQKCCSETCRKFIAPAPTIHEVAELANNRINQLAGRIAGSNRKLKNELIEKYSITL